MIARRTIVVGLGAAVAWPFAARAQQKAMPVIGFLSSASAKPFAGNVAAFRDGLKEAGYVEGQNLAIEFAWADGRYEKLPDLAADLVRRNVALIAAAGGAVTALAAQKATSTIPIVIAIGDDPIKFGLVSSLARPEGNITGVTLFIDVLTPKRFELLSELAPAARLAILANPKNPNAESEARAAEAAARQIGRDLLILYAGSPEEIAAAFAQVAPSQPSRAGAGGKAGGEQPGTALMIATDPFFFSRKDQLAELAAKHGIPAVYFHRDFVLAGGLLSYGATITGEFRLAGLYAGRILSGAKPSDLPVMQPTKFELVVNLKTAKTLGLTVPPSILARADEVIE